MIPSNSPHVTPHRPASSVDGADVGVPAAGSIQALGEQVERMRIRRGALAAQAIVGLDDMARGLTYMRSLPDRPRSHPDAHKHTVRNAALNLADRFLGCTSARASGLAHLLAAVPRLAVQDRPVAFDTLADAVEDLDERSRPEPVRALFEVVKAGDLPEPDNRTAFARASRIARALPVGDQAELMPVFTEAACVLGTAAAAVALARALTLFDQLRAHAQDGAGTARRDLAWSMSRALDCAFREGAPPAAEATFRSRLDQAMDMAQSLPPRWQPPLLAALSRQIPYVADEAVRTQLARSCLQACAALPASDRSQDLACAMLHMFGRCGRELRIAGFRAVMRLLRELPDPRLDLDQISRDELARALDPFDNAPDLRAALADARQTLAGRTSSTLAANAATLFDQAARLPLAAGFADELRANLAWLGHLDPQDTGRDAQPPSDEQLAMRQSLEDAFDAALDRRPLDDVPASLRDRLAEEVDAERERLLGPGRSLAPQRPLNHEDCRPQNHKDNCASKGTA